MWFCGADSSGGVFALPWVPAERFPEAEPHPGNVTLVVEKASF